MKGPGERWGLFIFVQAIFAATSAGVAIARPGSLSEAGKIACAGMKASSATAVRCPIAIQGVAERQIMG